MVRRVLVSCLAAALTVGVLLALGAVLRRGVPLLRAAYIPASVAGGLLGLLFAIITVVILVGACVAWWVAGEATRPVLTLIEAP